MYLRELRALDLSVDLVGFYGVFFLNNNLESKVQKQDGELKQKKKLVSSTMIFLAV